MTPNPRILAGTLRDILWIRIDGKGSHDISRELQQFATAQITAGARHLVVDLEPCPTMDSTFMGTLTGLAVRLMEHPGGRLEVVNANNRNRQLLENLGLDQIFEVDNDGSAWREERALVSAGLNQSLGGDPPGKREKCECMIEAHEHLSRANAANLPKFRDVLECLKREMDTMPA